TAQLATILVEQASAVEVIVSSAGNPSAGIVARTDGGNVATVISSSRNNRINSCSDIRASSEATHRLPPAVKARSISHIEASKLNEKNCRTRLSGRSPKVCARTSARLHKPLCCNSVPFGLPAEPEV